MFLTTPACRWIAIVGLLAIPVHSSMAQSEPRPGAQADSSSALLEEVLVFGSDSKVRDLPGSAALVGPEQIALEFANDINQLLKTVPGTYIREEDGYGLRPNIGIRGATSERSSKITLMEDGVMMAPAPYSNPAAYYFPTTLRMHSIEVLKGAPLLRHGPQTAGGVINLVSTPIPDELGGSLQARAGENGEVDIHANIGATVGAWGFLLESSQRSSEGFKDIDGGGRDSGFDMEDYVAKVSYESGAHALLLKAQYSDEVSNETYLGLTDTDFESAPNRRYGLSALDQMRNDHRSVSARYAYRFSPSLSMSALAYHNEFDRNWFRLANGNILIDAANRGDAIVQAALDGEQDFFNLTFRNNDRHYTSKGVELAFTQDVVGHELSYGFRRHQDDMDRFQPTDIYDQIEGELTFFETLAPSGGDNRLENAKALSAWVTDAWSVNTALRVNLALRYEDVETRRLQFSDGPRLALEEERFNNTREWLPGASLTWDMHPSVQLIAGIHRGFSPLGGGARENEDAETSINYELGVRYRGTWFVEAIGFYSDFANKTENCSNASPCSNGTIAGSFDTGDAVIQGMEFQASTTLSVGSLTMPLDIAYTFTDATVASDRPEEGFLEGDVLASVPEHAFSLRAGIETDWGWDNFAIVKYIDVTCVDVGCNRSRLPSDRTEALWVTDLISRYAVTDSTNVLLKIENVLDNQVIVARQPEGARPNKPLTASIGVQYSF